MLWYARHRLALKLKTLKTGAIRFDEYNNHQVAWLLYDPFPKIAQHFSLNNSIPDKMQLL